PCLSSGLRTRHSCRRCILHGGWSDRKAVDVTTRRRGWLLRSGLVAVLVAGGLGVIATPAFADGTLGVSLGQLTDFNAGDTQTLHVHVTYKQPVTGQQT